MSDIVEQEKIRFWLSSTSGSNQDPNLLSPFTDCTSLGAASSSRPDQSLQGRTLPDEVNVYAQQKNHSVSGSQSRSGSPPSVTSSRRLSSPLPITQNEVKRVHFSKSTKMNSTPQRGCGAQELDMATNGTPSRDPVHSRLTPRSLVDKVDDAPQYYYHARNNSISSSQGFPQLGGLSSSERGRPVQKKFEFPSSDSDNLLSPVPEGVKKNHPSHVTTMSDMISRGNDTPSRGSRSMSRHKSPPKPAMPSSAKSKEKHRPKPLDLRDAQKYGTIITAHANIQPVHNPITPDEVDLGHAMDSPSSVYTDDTRFQFYDEPAVSPIHALDRSGMGQINVLRGYHDWKLNSPAAEQQDTNGYPGSNGVTGHDNSSHFPEAGNQMPRGRSPSKVSRAGSDLSESAPVNRLPKESEIPPFTPLTPWLMDAHTRKATKTLIGDKGWLEDTAADARKPEAKKNTKFFDNVKKTARKFAEMAEIRTGQPKIHTARELNISLDPREQSLLYCELEFILSNALSAYINIQLHSGRLNPHIHAKISDAWDQKGRPKVIGFRYDLETQCDMIAAHIGTFRFYGPFQTDHTVIKGLLYGMKMNARVMRIHTYCQPDPVIAKHILDSQAVVQLLDSPESLQISLAEVSQFFRVVLEREKSARQKKEVDKASLTEYAPNKGAMEPPRSYEDLSPPKSKYPGEYRIKNRIDTPGGARNFSGPTLEPEVYDPSIPHSHSYTWSGNRQQ